MLNSQPRPFQLGRQSRATKLGLTGLGAFRGDRTGCFAFRFLCPGTIFIFKERNPAIYSPTPWANRRGLEAKAARPGGRSAPPFQELCAGDVPHGCGAVRWQRDAARQRGRIQTGSAGRLLIHGYRRRSGDGARSGACSGTHWPKLPKEDI